MIAFEAQHELVALEPSKDWGSARAAAQKKTRVIQYVRLNSMKHVGNSLRKNLSILKKRKSVSKRGGKGHLECML